MHNVNGDDLRTALAELPELCAGLSARLASPPPFATSTRPIRNVVITGAGVSGLAGQLFRDLVLGTAAIPVYVHSNYILPAFVGPETLVVALSYSGTTQETIYAVSDAAEKRAQMLAVTSGGHLRDIAEAQEFPCIALPSGISTSPSRLAATVFALWNYLGLHMPQVRLLGETAISDRDEALALLRRQRDIFTADSKPGPHAARQLAEVLQWKTPLLVGSPALAAVAKCWEYWFHEIANRQSSAHAFPAVEHENLLDSSANPRLHCDDATIVLLRDRQDNPLIASRIDTIRDRLLNTVPELPVHEIYADGKSLFARVWTSLYLGAWTAASQD